MPIPNPLKEYPAEVQVVVYGTLLSVIGAIPTAGASMYGVPIAVVIGLVLGARRYVAA